ncbi:hypothetical protein L2E82_05649 [Cichorium intybus]|uniref:Uncharacterized protein n=1 Tax=Cichorium intybus TaxID=13427 RepID=A0ACB9H963_CICIN|nr:hypothetical protein L2E82_05649 [Cichorium intybus]
MTKNFPELGMRKEDCVEGSWIDAVLYWANFDNTTAPEILLDRQSDSNFRKRKSDYVQTPISVSGIRSIFSKLVELGRLGFVFNPYGGKMNEIAADATPMPHRAGNLFKIQDLDIGVMTGNNCSEGKVYGEMYFMGNFDRLVKIKTAVDPDNFFINEQSIPTLPGKSSGKSRKMMK